MGQEKKEYTSLDKENKKEEILKEFRFENEKAYRDFLDQAPKDAWLQLRDLGKGRVHKFIPIFITEANADFVMQSWNVTSEEVQSMSNGVTVTVRIEAIPDYPGAREIFFTGSGAIQFKDTKNHIEYDIPNARERAIANAFKTLGNIFGRSLNRTFKALQNGEEKKFEIQPDFSLRNPKKKEEPKK